MTELAQRATGLLGTFNRAGVLDLADVHVADRVARLGGEADEVVRLALALAVRGLRLGSVCIDLTGVGTTVPGDSDEPVDVSALPWPDPDAWRAACERSPLVAVGPDAGPGRPLRLVHGLLYLDRYWRQEEQVRSELRRRELAAPPVVDIPRLRAALARLFPDDEQQRLAGALSALRWVTVVAGGPGTGKTTTVARLLALLCDQPRGAPRAALAAPTGKAAARLEQAVRSSALPDVARLGDVRATTLHRLLGVLPGSRSRFRHDRHNRLPYDVIVVDETSMVSLTLMARLLEAARHDTRLVLVGDPDQLASVEAGAVLGDLTRAPGSPDPALQARLAEILGPDIDPVVNGVVTLRRPWRYDREIDALARAIQAGDGDTTVELLRAGHRNVIFVETGVPDHPEGLGGLRADVVAAAGSLSAAARRGDLGAALAALDAHRLLCAHRRGPHGVSRWGAEVERWLRQQLDGYATDGEWYPGRPLLITANDHDLGLYNGDTGVVVHSPSGPRAVFGRGGAPTVVAPVRLSAVQTVHAMTVHRSQGSQFERVSVLLPPAESPLLTRELLYTAVTRARTAARVIGTEAAVRAAVRRPITRASGLRRPV